MNLTRKEVLALKVRHVNLNEGTLTLDPGTTKNGEGRVAYMTPELKSMVAAQIDRIRGLEKQVGILPDLFPHLSGRHVGQLIGNFRGAWEKACRLAGCPGMLRHDMRRSAVRNLVNAGVPERVAMDVTGHKTRVVFNRYHIVSPADLQEAARRLAGTETGTAGHISLDAQSVSR